MRTDCPWTPEPSKLFCLDYPDGCDACIKKVVHLKPKIPTYRDTTPIDELYISLEGKVFLESNDKITIDLYRLSLSVSFVTCSAWL